MLYAKQPQQILLHLSDKNSLENIRAFFFFPFLVNVYKHKHSPSTSFSKSL